MNADGTGQRRLTYILAPDRLPTWSPSGREIMFESARASKRLGVEVYAVKVATGKVRRVTNRRGDDGNPDWRLARLWAAPLAKPSRILPSTRAIPSARLERRKPTD